jgi:hypothetical protein
VAEAGQAQFRSAGPHDVGGADQEPEALESFALYGRSMPPLPQIDSQSFTRLTTSLGLLFCALAIAVPALILRDSGVLRISQRELSGLTPVARQELERRQRLSRDLGEKAWPLGAGFALVGLALLVYSLPRLRKQEAKLERRSDLELEQLLGQQGEAERDEILTREAREEVLASAAASLPDDGSVGETNVGNHIDRGEGEPAARVPNPDLMAALEASLAAVKGDVQQIEDAVLDRLEAIVPRWFRMRRFPRVGTLRLDALLSSEVDQLPDVVVEVKALSDRELGPRARDAADRGIALAARYQALTGRSALAWVIVVLSTDAQPALSDAPVGTDLPDTVEVSVIRRDELDRLTLPARLTG